MGDQNDMEKRTEKDDRRFAESFEKMIKKVYDVGTD